MELSFDATSKCRLTVDVSDVKQAFEFLAYAETVFGVDQCGNCSSSNLKLDHRQPQGYDYYSVVCKDCRHEFKFGQVKESGQLFQKGWEPPYESDGDSTQSSDDERETAQTASSTF